MFLVAHHIHVFGLTFLTIQTKALITSRIIQISNKNQRRKIFRLKQRHFWSQDFNVRDESIYFKCSYEIQRRNSSSLIDSNSVSVHNNFNFMATLYRRYEQIYHSPPLYKRKCTISKHLCAFCLTNDCPVTIYSIFYLYFYYYK